MDLDWKIIVKKMRNIASDEDLKTLEQWRNENPSNKNFYDEIERYYRELNEKEAFFDVTDAKVDEMWRNGMRKRILRKKISLKKIVVTVSAAVAVVLSSFVVYNLVDVEKPIRNLAENRTIPASKNVRITTETGRVYCVSDEHNSTGDLVINGDKKLDYTKILENKQVADEVVYHKIEVPKGCTYTILLSDSTEVLINANSELSYPKNFAKSSTREVYLKGEAYFNVKKGQNLFIVNTDCSQVKVYGTEFNVNCYSRLFTETVLVRGSVGVQSISGGAEVKIKPNQKSIVNNYGKNVVTDVDVRGCTSWKNGYFFYNGESLKNIVVALSNWYDVQFKFENPAVENIEIVASFDRDLSLNEVLKMIEDITFVKFKNEGEMVKVY